MAERGRKCDNSGVQPGPDDWRNNLLVDPADIRSLIVRTKRVAVLGMKTEMHADQPAFYVPAYLDRAGLDVVPVLVYYPGVTEVLGKKAYRKVSDVPGPLDMVNVFRRPDDIPPHVDDIVAAKPYSVWFQSGIRNDAAAEVFARAGIRVVQDRCLMVDHRRTLLPVRPRS